MKVIEPKITCLVMSHMKPTLIEALKSLEQQTINLNCIEKIIVDSGLWMDLRPDDEMFKKMSFIYHETIRAGFGEWYFTGEPNNFREKKCPVSYWTNKAIELGLVRGKYFCCHYDDDIYYPTFMEKMAGYLDEHPEAMAVRCTQNRTKINPDGTQTSTSPLEAKSEIVGPHMDCVVDGQQVMMRTEVLTKLKEKYGNELLPEDPDISSCSHSDGIFLNRMGEIIDKLHFINEPLCEHRNTVYSTYTPSNK